jgi:DNA-binding response OmpR family regulator
MHRDNRTRTTDRRAVRRSSGDGRRRASALPHILIVDPDEPIRLIYRQALEMAGHGVVEASDGRDALVKALDAAPSLVIVKAELPIIDGLALCEILRQDRATHAIPVMLLSDGDHVDVLQRARRIGVDAVVTEPVRLEDLVDEASRLIGQDGRQPRRQAVNTSAAANRNGHGNGHGNGNGNSARLTQAKAHVRFNTRSPATPPPELRCRLCDSELVYQFSHIGGVNQRHPEQWDYFVCSHSCATYEYRQRTRRLREVDEHIVRSMR